MSHRARSISGVSGGEKRKREEKGIFSQKKKKKKGAEEYAASLRGRKKDILFPVAASSCLCDLCITTAGSERKLLWSAGNKQTESCVGL